MSQVGIATHVVVCSVRKLNFRQNAKLDLNDGAHQVQF